MAKTTERRQWLTAEGCRLEDFIECLASPTSAADHAHAESIERGVPIYRSEVLREAVADPAGRRAVLAELAACFESGPGIAVFTGAVATGPIARVSAAFEAMIADQHRRGVTVGDHYAKPGANDRVWNALEKLAVDDPGAFVDYYESEIIALVSESWLGPAYQVTSQVNVVNPGGQAQRPHRDYHLGFLTDAEAERFPAHVHRLSPTLTLQGAVAHCDMPVETGPTLYLPHSQKYEPGYLAWRRPEFVEYFERHHVQLPLSAGDAVFFNPALFHAAGTNRTADVRRMANLLQVSSAFGRAMESVDRTRMCLAVYPALCERRDAGWSAGSLGRVVAACAEGYAFPTNLDSDPPIAGLAPPSPADVVRQALTEAWTPERLADELHAGDRRRSTNVTASSSPS